MTLVSEYPIFAVVSLPKTIKTLRLAQGLSQKALAEKLDAPASCVSDWEAGTTQPRRSRLHKLAKILKTTTTRLLMESLS